MIRSIEVHVRTPIYDTEVTDRVKDAVRNLFPDADVTTTEGELRATAHSLEHFAELLGRQEILDTARKQFQNGQQADQFSFILKKQAAFEEVVNFAVGDPDELGDIHVTVTVETPSVDEYIDHIAPATENGQPPDRYME